MGDVTADVLDNQKNWNDRADVHAAGGYGDLEAFAADESAITSVVSRDMEVLAPHVPNGSVHGLSLLHLQCHIGTDTLSWARLGALDVHGLDFSEQSLEHARSLAARAGRDITYVLGMLVNPQRLCPANVSMSSSRALARSRGCRI